MYLRISQNDYLNISSFSNVYWFIAFMTIK